MLCPQTTEAAQPVCSSHTCTAPWETWCQRHVFLVVCSSFHWTTTKETLQSLSSTPGPLLSWPDRLSTPCHTFPKHHCHWTWTTMKTGHWDGSSSTRDEGCLQIHPDPRYHLILCLVLNYGRQWLVCMHRMHTDWLEGWVFRTRQNENHRAKFTLPVRPPHHQTDIKANLKWSRFKVINFLEYVYRKGKTLKDAFFSTYFSK